MKHLTLGVATLALFALPATANAQLFGGFDNNSVLGGVVGAGLGGAIGSNLAGSGVRDEGTAIGAVLGGLAGTAYGNSQSRYGGNPYAGTFNPGFSGNTLIGTGIGAGLGGAIGSNLAGSGQRQEGTAIGAVLGGLAGYGIANARNTQNIGNQGYNGGYAPQFAPTYGQNFAPNYGPSYGGVIPNTPLTSNRYGGPVGGFAPHYGGGFAPTAPVQYIPSGQYVGASFPQVNMVRKMPAPVMQAPQTRVYVMQPDITVAAPNVRLAGPSLQRPDINRGLVRVEQMPIARAERQVIYTQAPHSHSHHSAPQQAALPIAPSRYDVSGGQCGTPSTPTCGMSAPAPQAVYQEPVYQQPSYQPAADYGHNHTAKAKTYCYKGSNRRYRADGAEFVGGCNH